MLELKFDPKLDYQLDVVNSTVDLFEGQVKKTQIFNFITVINKLVLNNDELLSNLKRIQKTNGIDASNIINEPYQYTIEMETGTGKTYIYLRTIIELNIKYGFSKFIIIVPSIAIKEGVLKTLQITKNHFAELYSNIPYTFFTYDSSNLGRLRVFAQSTKLQIMIISRDAFNKDLNIIHNVQDRMGARPIDVIKKTRPILILDEPQKMEGDATQWGIEQYDPLFILRYSATHKERINLIYNLSPYDAYNYDLVKKIEVASITREDDPYSKQVILEQITRTRTGSLRAKLKVFVKEKTGIKFKIKTFKHGDNLEKTTKNEYYSGFIINEINYSKKFVSFSNGIRVYIGQASVNEEEILKTMVKETIESHLEKKSELNPIGIKVLSLFFINRVDDYLPQDSILRRVFEETYIELVTNEFPEFSGIDPKTIHSGYFSRMRQASSIERDEEAFNLIMRDKERLLSLDEPVEFIFSHSALREGWDNPNVFNICTLSYSQSEIKKRQEIGRGLRLPVNSQGERIQDREINKLTVVTNESYHEYVSKLQTEFREDAGIESPPIENKRERTTLRLKEPMLQTSDFIDLWRRLSPKVNYDVNIDSNELIKKCVKEINQLDIKPLKLNVVKYLIDEITPEETLGEVSSEGYEEIKLDKTFNIVHYIEQETKLTRKTIYEIIKGVNNFDQFFKNPQSYADNVATIIKNNLTNLILDKIEYQEISEEYQLDEFKTKIETYDKYIVELHNDKTPYKLEYKPADAVNIDPGPGETGVSTPELDFAKALDRDSRIKLFIKLPDWYKIPTPIGNYNPDWAILVEKKNKEGRKEKMYFIIETKGTDIIGYLREHEQQKIKSARRRFKATTQVRFEAPVKDFRSFERIFSD